MEIRRNIQTDRRAHGEYWEVMDKLVCNVTNEIRFALGIRSLHLCLALIFLFTAIDLVPT